MLDCVVSVVSASFEREFALDAPSVVVHVVDVEVLVRVIPAHHVQEVVVVEDVVRERANFWKAWISFHEVLFDVKAEAFVSPHRLIEATKDENGLTVDRHAHRQIAGRPGRFRVEVDHAPHVMVNIVHLNRICDLFLVELGATTEHVDVLVIEDATGGGVSCHV